jgi:hypothetical protein
VPSQLAQLAVSGCSFRRSRALAGGVLFTEAEELEPLRCTPAACVTDDDNTAEDYGNVSATPPAQFLVHLPASVRSGAPLELSVTLVDSFGSIVTDWVDTVATVASDVQLAGALRAFYADGRAVFPDVSLHGEENSTHVLNITLRGPDLYGHGVDARSFTQAVIVESCAPGETFDAAALECLCADGFGLVAGNNSCATCAADEVVPPGQLSCAACPLFSTPAPGSLSQCRCGAGYFGVIAGATGACTQCAPDSYRAADDPPTSCVACPATSHTFAPGARGAAECLCAENHFADYEAASASNASFTCSRVPVGGWAPQADSRLFSLEGYWRPDAAHTKFYICTAGLCMREEPDASGNHSAPQLGHACRDGHGGHLCAVCAPGYSYQGTFCSQCEVGTGYGEWSAAKKGGLIFVGSAMLVVVFFFLFCLPLCPRVEAALRAMVQPMVNHLDVAIGTLIARPQSAGRPRSAAAAEPAVHRGLAAAHPGAARRRGRRRRGGAVAHAAAARAPRAHQQGRGAAGHHQRADSQCVHCSRRPVLRLLSLN